MVIRIFSCCEEKTLLLSTLTQHFALQHHAIEWKHCNTTPSSARHIILLYYIILFQLQAEVTVTATGFHGRVHGCILWCDLCSCSSSRTWFTGTFPMNDRDSISRNLHESDIYIYVYVMMYMKNTDSLSLYIIMYVHIYIYHISIYNIIIYIYLICL